jgi:hypothetical protein
MGITSAFRIVRNVRRAPELDSLSDVMEKKILIGKTKRES